LSTAGSRIGQPFKGIEMKKPGHLRKSSFLPIWVVALVIISVVITALLAWAYIRDSSFLKRAVRGQATVLSETYQYNSKGAGTLYLKISFQPTISQTVEGTISVLGDYKIYPVGQKVDFLYDPDDFQTVRSLQWASQLPQRGIFVFAFPILMFLFGLVLYFRRRSINGKK
jgi:hypothetical protein